MNHQDDDRVLREALADTLEAIGKDTGEAIAALRRRGQATRRSLHLLYASLALIAMTMGGMVYLAVGLAKNNTDLEHVQERTRNDVLCPLYDLFEAAGKRPPPPNMTEQQKAQRVMDFAAISQQREALGCEDR